MGKRKFEGKVAWCAPTGGEYRMGVQVTA
jgi:hypothetical protein